MTTRISRIIGTPELPTSVGASGIEKEDFSLLVFQPERPIADGELNQVQLMQNLARRDVLRALLPSTGLFSEIYPTLSTSVPNELVLHTEGQPFQIVIDGVIKNILNYDNPVSATPDKNRNRIRLPEFLTAGQEDLVYIELWNEEVEASTSIGEATKVVYEKGNVGNFTLPNNIRISEIPLNETSRRVQLRAEIKTIRSGGDLTGITAKNTAAVYRKENDYYIAGNGDIGSAVSTGTVDGVVYALPLVLLSRQTATTLRSIKILPPIINKLGMILNESIKDNTITESKFHSEVREQLHGMDYFIGISGGTNNRIVSVFNDGSVNDINLEAQWTMPLGYKIGERIYRRGSIVPISGLEGGMYYVGQGGILQRTVPLKGAVIIAGFFITGVGFHLTLERIIVRGVQIQNQVEEVFTLYDGQAVSKLSDQLGIIPGGAVDNGFWEFGTPTQV